MDTKNAITVSTTPALDGFPHGKSIDRIRESTDSVRMSPTTTTLANKRGPGFFSSFAMKLLHHSTPPPSPSPLTAATKVHVENIKFHQPPHLKNQSTTVPQDASMLALTNNNELTQLAMFKRLKNQWTQSIAEGLDIDAAHRIGLASFLAAMHGPAHLAIQDPDSLSAALQVSLDILSTRAADVYGVDTAFGGNADVHSDDPHAVQVGLIRLLTAGMSNHIHHASTTRGAMILRVLSMSRGGSAVRLELIQVLIKLIEARVTPCVPLRGSISASGDLMPLSYIAGLISGRFENAERAALGPKGQFLTGKQALKLAGISKPIVFEAKEALALVNGTSFSCALAATCILESHTIALLVQVITAFSVETLAGHVDAFDPAVARLRPHPGQIELCFNISHLLRDSQLVGKDKSKLAPLLWRRNLPQDRYSLRTAPQWLCPLLECLTSITKTIEIEINSVNDNPLVDVEKKAILHAGNFQALSVADAMDRLRLQLHNAGRLIFAQHSELINPTLNQGLPANLAFGHPGTDFGFKGLDVSMASYLSELGDVALPMSVHVQSAELHNQSINSLALISARKTERAIEIVQMMSSCLIAALCQAADLRSLESDISRRTHEAIVSAVSGLHLEKSDRLVHSLMDAFASKLLEHRETGWPERVEFAVTATLGLVINSPECEDCSLPAIKEFRDTLRRGVLEAIRISHSEVGAGQGAKFLSTSSKSLYDYVRKTKKIPMYQDEKMINIGRMLDQILAAVQNREELDHVLLDCFEEPEIEHDDHSEDDKTAVPDDESSSSLDDESITDEK
ncbi:hypothetical protein HDU98_006584 [Podochytrium sp. JEL0797]|nr:hypothetical protein HDU98_006584 [Podochytrium sp. JEL0797]